MKEMMVNGQRNIRQCNGKGIECRMWADLPQDVLNLIIGRLPSVVDQIRFRCVCKNWHLAEFTQYACNIPWLIGHQWEFSHDGDFLSSCKFHIPSTDKIYTSKNVLEGEAELMFGAGICASKYHWLLLQKDLRAFFYKPFSKKIIELPPMDIHFNRATFSSSPTSPDCVCFVIQSYKNCDKIHIRICSPGDREWCTIVFDGFRKVIEDVVYQNGKFYCVFNGGVLGAFDVADHGWSVLTTMNPLRGILPYPIRSRAQMVESNGDLLLVCHCERIYVFGFDWSEGDWVRRFKLENQAIFLGCTSFSVAAEGENSYLADRIYHHGPRHTCFYSYSTGRSQQCMEIYHWLMDISGERIWIEAPQI